MGPRLRIARRPARMAWRFALALRHLVPTGDLDEPVPVKAAGYSHPAGKDIRRTCDPKGLPRHRPVHIGRHEEPVRSCDLAGLAPGDVLRARALGGARSRLNPADSRPLTNFVATHKRSLTRHRVPTYMRHIAVHNLPMPRDGRGGR